MNIFICWSGERSRKLAKVLQFHLPLMIPALSEPGNDLFVSDDIEKGTRWFDAVEQKLETADAGLVCITRESLQSGWIHFESGALARAVRKNARQSGRLYTYLLGVEPGELKGPLGEFQSTTFERDDTKRLCLSLVTVMTQGSSSTVAWETAFEKTWPEFKGKVKAIGPLAASMIIPELEDIFQRKTFNEPLDECARQSWLDRFTGARETIASLRGHAKAVNADNTYVLDLYNELLAQLDSYAMNMGALLLEEKRFEISPEDGKLVIGGGIKRACEGRRARIRSLVTHLLAPNCAPVLEKQSRQYAKLPSFDAKKELLIHPAERKIRSGQRDDQLSPDQLDRCAESLWEFDRIYFYLVKESSKEADIEPMVRCVEHELEKATAVEGAAGLIPLHYALRALKSTIRRVQPESAASESVRICAQLMTSIEEFVGTHDLDRGGQVRKNVQELRSILQSRMGGGGSPGGGASPSPVIPVAAAAESLAWNSRQDTTT